MTFHRQVQVGGVVMMTYGPDYGKLAVIVEIIDHGRVLVEGPTTGVSRQSVSFKRCTLTDIVLKNIPRGVGSVALKKAVEKQELHSLWEKTSWAKKLNKRATRAGLSDFARFKLMVAKKTKASVVGKSFAAAKKEFAKQ